MRYLQIKEADIVVEIWYFLIDYYLRKIWKQNET